MATTADETSNPPPSEDEKRKELTDLIAKATAEYAVKHYSEAAELYSQATEIQAELNGDLAVENADLLYSYGKCLFFVAQQTSSVLGGTAASAQLSSSKAQKSSKKRKANGTTKTEANGSTSGSGLKLDSVKPEGSLPNVGDVVPEQDVQQPQESTSDKPFFQISGDAAEWDDSDDDDEADQDEEADEGEDDDFANSYELLDLARVLYLKKLEQLEEKAPGNSEKGKSVASIESTPEIKSLKGRVADIYDLQAEVGLEGEKYSDAATDLTACLALREELDPPESSLLAECHYKLSLALEFSGNTQKVDAQGNPTGEILVDWTVRNKAIVEAEKAIESCKLRISKETASLDSLEAGPAKEKAKAQIEDVEGMVTEMEVRLAELRQPPVSVKAESENEMKQQISGVLGSLLGSGATEEEKKEKLAQVTETATDISGMVKRKKPKSGQANGGESGYGSSASTPAAVPVSAEGSSLGKRKVEFVAEAEVIDSGKKARVEDTEDSGL